MSLSALVNSGTGVFVFPLSSRTIQFPLGFEQSLLMTRRDQ